MQLNKPFAAVTPTLDGDVLAVLASADASFTISQIQRILAHASGEGIRKVLNRLAAQGVLLHDRVGRTHTYQLNSEHLAAEPIIALARLHATFLHRLEQHLNEWGEMLQYAALFGSAATGRMTPDSDIDVLLVRARGVDDAPWEQRTTELSLRVAAWTGNDCRVVEYTEEEFTTAVISGEPLLGEVSRHGLTVAGERSWLSTLDRRS